MSLLKDLFDNRFKGKLHLLSFKYFYLKENLKVRVNSTYYKFHEQETGALHGIVLSVTVLS